MSAATASRPASRPALQPALQPPSRPVRGWRWPQWRQLAARPGLHRWLGLVLPALSARLALRLTLWPQPPAAPAEEQAVLAAARTVDFRCGQRGLHWGEHGPVVVLQHGWEGRPSQFARLVPMLLDAGRQVVALAAPAHDGGPRRDANVLLFSQALRQAADEIGEVEAVVGHSMGGAAALLAARDGMRVERVVALACPSALALALDRSARALALTPRAHRLFRELVDRRIGVPASDIDVARCIQGLALPTLLVHDLEDRSVPYSEAQALARALPAVTLVSTRGLRHTRALADEQVMSAVARFATGWVQQAAASP